MANATPLIHFNERFVGCYVPIDDMPTPGTIVPTKNHSLYGFKIPDIATAKVACLSEGDTDVQEAVKLIRQKCEELDEYLLNLPSADSEIIVKFNALTSFMPIPDSLRPGLKTTITPNAGKFERVRQWDPTHQPPRYGWVGIGSNQGQLTGIVLPEVIIPDDLSKKLAKRKVVQRNTTISSMMESVKSDGTVIRYYEFDVLNVDPATLT